MSTSLLPRAPLRPFPRPGRLLASLALLVVLGACGLKGDLYLPEPEPAEPSVTPNQTDDPESDDEENS